jgi:hypothetical protein
MKLEQLQVSSVQLLFRFNFIAALLVLWIWGMESDEGPDGFIHLLCVLAMAILGATLSQEVIIYRKLRRAFSNPGMAIADRLSELPSSQRSAAVLTTAPPHGSSERMPPSLAPPET